MYGSGLSVGLHASVAARAVIGLTAGSRSSSLVGRVEFFEDVGLEFAVGADGLDDLLALLVTGLLDEVGDLRAGATSTVCDTGYGVEPSARG